MIEATVNLFDIAVLMIVGLSALLSFYRGFVREILSLSSWLLASFVALRFLEPATSLLKPHIGSEPVAAGVAAIGLFFTTMILFSVTVGSLAKLLKVSAKVGKIDNLVGLGFGVARGMLIVAIGYFIMSKFFTDEKNYPELVQRAVTRPYIEKCANWIATITPNYLDKVINENKNNAANKSPQPGVVRGMIESIEVKPSPYMDRALKDAGVSDDTSGMPSMDDLQKRIHEENERNNAR